MAETTVSQSPVHAPEPARPSFQDTRRLKKEQFNPVEHHAPRYDIMGRVKPVHYKQGQDTKNILQHGARIPESWAASKSKSPAVKDIATAPEARTGAKLKQERKAENVPHSSYDLDGDGIVSAKDYFLAKRFDADQDGRLNTAEKETALRALEGGYENQFYWKVEQTGAHRGKRLLQVRGKFVDAEDFVPVASTYPKHPLSDVRADIKTVGELQKKRKEEVIANYKKAKDEWDKANPASVPQQYILSEFLADKPSHASMKQLKADERTKARKAIGLDEKTSDIKDVYNDPTTRYEPNPYIKTKTEFEAKIKEGNLEDLSKFGQTKNVGETDRLKAREDCILRLARVEGDRKTYKQLVEKQKKEMVDYNMRTFGNVSIGIHGKELPKFARTQNMKEYWKLAKTYRDKPELSSGTELRQTQKYWAKPDEMLLSDVKSDAAPTDPFKRTHVPRTAKTAIAEKINGINHFSGEPVESAGESSGVTMHTRWTEVVHYFAKKQGAYEEDPNMRQSLLRYEQLPLPSSFTPSGVFQDPLNKLRSTMKPQTSEAKLGKPSARMARGTKEQYRPPKENLLLRVSSKKVISPPEIDMRRTMTAGIRTGGFSGS